MPEMVVHGSKLCYRENSLTYLLFADDIVNTLWLIYPLIYKAFLQETI